MSSVLASSSVGTAPVFVIHGEHERTALRVPADAATLEGFRKWAKSDAFPERGVISFVEGEVLVDMSKENFDVHSSLKAAVSARVFQLVERRKLGLFFPDRCLLSNEQAQLSTEPDAMFVSRKSWRSGKVSFTESEKLPGTHVELVGSPDWVLEIVTPSSPRKDKELLRKAYYRAGVREYWIIDARGKQIEFVLLARGSRGFTEVKPVAGWRASPTFVASFRVTRKRDEDGFRHYTLHVKEKS